MHGEHIVVSMAEAHLGNAAGGIRSCAVGHYENGWRSGCSSRVVQGPASGLTHWQG